MVTHQWADEKRFAMLDPTVAPRPIITNDVRSVLTNDRYPPSLMGSSHKYRAQPFEVLSTPANTYARINPIGGDSIPIRMMEV